MNDDQALRDFVAKYARPYDPASDDYDRPPFARDILSYGRSDFYNLHYYPTKVPPEVIRDFILHYTEPGDLVLDSFCGSGMTGVAALMCANPPVGLLERFPEIRDRVGLRYTILNDLSPAACHIAYNYTNPVDVHVLSHEIERIKAEVKEEFDWLYGTEHYEPAIGRYDPKVSDIAEKLKNPSADMRQSSRMFTANFEKTWELIDREEVERRLGYPVIELHRGKHWGNIDVSKVNQWVSIPAIIQYTIWSDVYRCEGFITIEEPTGKISTRGKNVGKPIFRKKRVLRGCGGSIILWDVAMDKKTGKVSEIFTCPHCNQQWQKLSLKFFDTIPVHLSLCWIDIADKTHREQRRISCKDIALLQTRALRA